MSDFFEPSTVGKNYEYLDHTADVQIHSWGETLKQSFEGATEAMFGYMTDLSLVDIDESKTVEVEVEGHDLLSLLYNLLNEFLFVFGSEDYMVCKEVIITDFNAEAFTIKARGRGEPFRIGKHPQGTEVKAITYSNMQIHHEKPTHDVYVIIDI